MSILCSVVRIANPTPKSRRIAYGIGIMFLATQAGLIAQKIVTCMQNFCMITNPVAIAQLVSESFFAHRPSGLGPDMPNSKSGRRLRYHPRRFADMVPPGRQASPGPSCPRSFGVFCLHADHRSHHPSFCPRFRRRYKRDTHHWPHQGKSNALVLHLASTSRHKPPLILTCTTRLRLLYSCAIPSSSPRSSIACVKSRMGGSSVLWPALTLGSAITLWNSLALSTFQASSVHTLPTWGSRGDAAYTEHVNCQWVPIRVQSHRIALQRGAIFRRAKQLKVASKHLDVA